ncbi:MAG: SDR family oxidoreductase [Anaerolineae bacterium]
MSNTLLVTGASGHLGRRVIELLLEEQAGTIIATTRHPEKLADLAARGVVVRYANFDEESSLLSAFTGADRLLLISTDALDEPGKRLRQHTTAVRAAEQAGVSHVVYTSLIAADDSPVLFAPDHAGTEKALAASPMGWTVLRNNLYMELLIQSVSQAYQTGGLFSATGDGKVSYITREDCARAAAAALADVFEGQRILDITGAEALSQAEVAQIAGTLTGQPLTHTPIPVEALVQAMTGAGLPQPVAEVFASLDVAVAQGKMATVSEAFQTLTGEAPMRVADFLKAHKTLLYSQVSE